MLTKLMEKIYTWLAFATMLMGIVAAAMFILSLIVGGGFGESVSVFAGKFMTWGIRIAALAMVAGIVQIYANKQHTLTMNAENTEEPEKQEKTVNIKPIGRKVL
ncbi:hypothetical protein [Fictibacillus fluitans]|uniref:Uncharacterized protein n=1 Tax=Fictibacillus fluitans TaxID=3058422 RepID=A0ABT8I063_9BACL|nr:hypothetical protein [Fictibacillus sp. NE201]MDN4526428.1 hypothetical protein [Fictibacillus sp. NE201]